MCFGDYNYEEESNRKINWKDINHLQEKGFSLPKREKICSLYDRIEESPMGICGIDNSEVDERGGCHNPETCLKFKNFGIKVIRV